jgi:Mrp family chromosome partitioning ATPase
MTPLDRALRKAFAEKAPRAAAPESQQPAPAITPDDVPQPPGSLSPLSKFVGRPRIHESAGALLEVDHLAWPPACDDLLARSSDALHPFAEQIIERIGQGQKIVALASCRRGEGRTTVSLVVAKHLAARGLRPVVVDADSENPNLARNCGILDHAGWGDVLAGELPLGDALIAAVDDGVTLMPWRGAAVSTAQLAGSVRTARSFSMLRDHYDLVLLDTMPLSSPTAVSDFAGFAESIGLDALYLIHDVRSTSPEVLAETWAQLRGAGVNVAGIIENFVSPAGTILVAGPDKSKPVAGQKLAA